ncbi:MAG: tripartite tricarboxylate transporter permease [Candidatus Woesearchaeota archaeon]|jgi:putative membrane protein
MIIEIFFAILLGVLAGTFSGLSPGIHVNLVSAVVVGFAGGLIPIFGVEAIIVFIIAMAITHTFLDFLPSIFLGAPDPDNAISVLPGHKFLLEGKGFEAVKLMAIGSLFALLFCAILYVFLEKLLLLIYPFAELYIWQMIFVVSLFMIFSSGPLFRNIFVFLSAGILGVLVLGARMNEPLFPLLTGMFGIATLIFSLNEENGIPEQTFSKTTNVKKLKGFLIVGVGTITGFLTAVLPGIGASTAAAAGSSLFKEKEAGDFLILIGAITTVNFFMSIAALNVLGKARNGAIVALMKLVEKPPVSLMIMAALISAGIAVFISFMLAKWFIKITKKMNYSLLAKIVIGILILLTFIFSGFIGIYVLIISSSIGLYCNYKGIPRSLMMACIMMPVMMYFVSV